MSSGEQGPDTYQLEIRATVRRVGPRGEWRGSSGEGLTVDHQMNLGALDFLALAGVLGKFHDLGEEVRRAHEPATGKDKG